MEENIEAETVDLLQQLSDEAERASRRYPKGL